MINRLGHPDRLEVDNLISNLMQERLLSENEVKFVCDKVIYILLIIFFVKYISLKILIGKRIIFKRRQCTIC